MRAQFGPAFLVSAFLLLACQVAADDHYYESLSYTIETSAASTAYACRLSLVSLVTNLSRIQITVPFAREELAADPVVFLGKTGLQPKVTPRDGSTLLDVSFRGMKVGEMNTVDLRYVVKKGTAIKPGASIEVRTLGLAGNVTYHTLSLKLPGNYVISKIQTPDGIVKGSGGVPLNLGTEPVSLSFVVRKKNLLDSGYFVWGLAIAIIGLIAGSATYVWYAKVRPKASP